MAVAVNKGQNYTATGANSAPLANRRVVGGGGAQHGSSFWAATSSATNAKPSILMTPVIADDSHAARPSTSSQSAQVTPSVSSPYKAYAPGPGRRLRSQGHQPNVRRHIDYVSPMLNFTRDRLVYRRIGDRPAQFAHPLWAIHTLPVVSDLQTPIESVCLKFIRSAVNKNRCPIFACEWSPNGQRLVTGSSTGELTLWSGSTFSFETILQAHDTAIRALEWSHSDQWLVTADHDGYMKYWQPNMNNVHAYQAHKEPVRTISFSPTDHKLVTGSDDATVRVWDFEQCHEERIMRGHGSDVRCVDWHPHKGLIASGSRDNQQPVKLWDPRTGKHLCTLHDHKNSVMAVQWNENGNWLLTGSRDHQIKLYDIRIMKELNTYRGHKKEVTALEWHPHHEEVFASGGADGSLYYWSVDSESIPLGSIERAHEQSIWALSWHPLGHVLTSGSNDNATKFWSRSKPGDALDDFYNQTAASAQATVLPQSGNVRAQTDYSHETTHQKLPLLGRGGTIPDPMKSLSGKSDSIPGLGITQEVREHLSHVQLPLHDPGDDQDSTMLDQATPRIQKAQRNFAKSWNVSMGETARETGVYEGVPLLVPKPKQSLLGPAPAPRPPMPYAGAPMARAQPTLAGAPPSGPGLHKGAILSRHPMDSMMGPSTSHMTTTTMGMSTPSMMPTHSVAGDHATSTTFGDSWRVPSPNAQPDVDMRHASNMDIDLRKSHPRDPRRQTTSPLNPQAFLPDVDMRVGAEFRPLRAQPTIAAAGSYPDDGRDRSRSGDRMRHNDRSRSGERQRRNDRSRSGGRSTSRERHGSGGRGGFNPKRQWADNYERGRYDPRAPRRGDQR